MAFTQAAQYELMSALTRGDHAAIADALDRSPVGRAYKTRMLQALNAGDPEEFARLAAAADTSVARRKPGTPATPAAQRFAGSGSNGSPRASRPSSAGRRGSPVSQ